MDWLGIGTTVLVMTALAFALKPLSVKLKLPYPTLLVLGGFLASELLVALGVDTGLRWDNFHQLVYFVLLPVLIYEIAFRLKAGSLLSNMLAILLLSMPLMLVGVLVAAILLFAGIDHAVGFPFVAALIAAALMMANDPAAVAYMMAKLQPPQRIISMLKGESLFNSLLALVLVSLALSVEMAGNDDASGTASGDIGFIEGFVLFVQLFTGGVLVGLAGGLVGWFLLHFSRLPVLRGIISIVIAYATFWLAEQYLGVSGIVAVLTAGLLLNAYAQRTDIESKQLLNKLWEVNASVAGVVLFLLLGMSIYLPILMDQWIAVLLGIGVALLVRALMVFVGLGLFARFIPQCNITLREQVAVFWGGMKGGVTIALVFALPAALGYSETIQAMVYGVVLFSLFVQMPTLKFVLD